MQLTSWERRVLGRVRADPLTRAADIAEATGREVAEVEQALDALHVQGAIRGWGYVVGPRAPVVVVGGAVMDLKSQTDAPPRLGTSNPGRRVLSPGGVGRNIAENLARLGQRVELVAAIGDDAMGQELLERTRAAGVGMGSVITSRQPTGAYVAVLDDRGELFLGVSDMTATDELTVGALTSSRDLLSHAELLVIDGNLPEAVIGWLLDFAAAAQVPVVLDPVSVPKATHLTTTIGPARPMLAVTPNVGELGAIIGREVRDDDDAIARAAAVLHAQGVHHVWVRRGAAGSFYSEQPPGQATPVTAYLPAPPAEVVDVTGGGDAMTAGFIHHYLEHGVGIDAARFGQMTAALTVETSETVRPDLTPALVQARLQGSSDRAEAGTAR